MTTSLCPCGSGLQFTHCCNPYLSGQLHPATAEALMRSRYTAYVQHNESYLRQSWHNSTRPQTLGLDQQPPIKWLGLKIIRTQAGGEDDRTGIVEFVARYKINGKAQRLHETSHFIREGGCWLYVNGELADNPY